MPDQLMLVDGNSLINRAYYGLNIRNPLTAPDGTPTGALYAFINMLLKYIEEVSPEFACVAFDLKDETFRHKMYDEYKSQRKQMPEELAVQIPLLKELLDAMGIPRFEISGYEADDIIGTLASATSKNGHKVSIITGDKDSFQLVSENVLVLQPLTRSGQSDTQVVDIDAVRERYQVAPEQLIDIKALMGDPSDNIPGVKGIGEKGAVSLISKYGSLDRVYENLDELAPSVAAKLKRDKEIAYLSRELSIINLEVPVEIDLQNWIIRDPDKNKLAQLFQKYGFKSLTGKFGLDGVISWNNSLADDKNDSEHELIEMDAEQFFAELSLNSDKLICAASEDCTFWLSVFQRDEGDLILSDQTNVCHVKPAEIEKFWNFLLKASSDKSQHGKSKSCIAFYDYKSFLRNNRLLPLALPPHDILTAGYLLNQIDGKPDFARLYQSAAGKVWQYSKTMQTHTQIGLNMTGDETDSSSLLSDSIQQTILDYDRKTVIANITVAQAQSEEFLKSDDFRKLMFELEMPLTGILAKMEQKGFKLDRQELERLSDTMSQELESLQKQIFELSGTEFNLNSPKQLGQVLFEQLKLPAGKKRTGGSYSTDAEELSRLYHEHAVIPYILNYRQISKLKSTFVDGLKRQIDPQDKRVHTTFSQVQTSTGRLSSSEPNLQNIPIRSEAGAQIRKVFIAAENCILLDADYSQIELRLLAHLSQDPAMIEAFSQNQDIHLNTACSIFDLPVEKITSEQRSIAKTVNFSIVYGISNFGLARDLGIPVKTAQKYIEGYNSRYPLVRKYLDSLIEFGNKNGYVETMFGRRRYLPELKSSNRNVRHFGQRAAMNAPVQGTAADLIKKAMVMIDGRLKENRLNGQIILQVHDELILEVPSAEADLTAKILRDCMENAISISVPLLAEVHSGKCWADCK